MRRPQVGTDKKDKKCHTPSQSSGGPFARMKRFLSASIGGHHSTQHSLAPLKDSSEVLSQTTSPTIISLRAEAESILGRSLEDLMRDEEKEIPQGVPTFVHDLCCHMLTHGVDYDTLVGDNWCPNRDSLLEGLPPSLMGDLSTEGAASATVVAGLFRLFLEELPHPLLDRDAAASLTRLCKEFERSGEGRDVEMIQEKTVRVRDALLRTVPPYNLNMLQYLTAFLHQLRTANHNTCPVTPSALSRLLGLVLTEGGMKEESNHSSLRLAEMLLLNHAVIFRDSTILSQETNYSSDSVSSNCDSRGGETTDDADLFTPDDDYDEDDDNTSSRGGGPRDLLGEEEEEEEEEDDSTTTTTTTTDTDEFRSPPVSPIKSGAERPPMSGDPESSSSPRRSTSRSTDELGDGESFISKIAPYGKEYLPSITGLLTSPYESSWTLDVFRPKEGADSQDDFNNEPSAESSCVSGEEISELESEEDRDADGSDTEGAPQTGETQPPCPHEERRSTERFLLRGHHSSSSSSTGRKTKRKIRRRHSKESSNRIQSSEEEERDLPNNNFASLLSRDDPPAPFDPTPPETSQSFSALLSSEEPVTSYRASWGQRQEDSLDDNWQRTTPLYNRDDEVDPLKSSVWYRDENVDQGSYRSSKYRDPSLSDSLDEGSRPRGHSEVKSLTKVVNGLKKKIKKFEEEFEKTFGYRPSHSDKMKHKEIKKYMSELSKAKKELKQIKDDVPEKRIRTFQKPFPMSLLRCQEATASGPSPPLPNNSSPPSNQSKDTYRQVEERLSVKRNEAGRPIKVCDLTLDQLKEEKTDIQKALLFYESVHGRPYTREDKELVRPLYDRYRLVKRSVNKLTTRPKENVIELAPILEHVVMDFTLASPQHRGSLKGEEEALEEEAAIAALPLNPDPHPELTTPSQATTTSELNLGDLHALPIHELKERKKEAREEKRRLRHALREYEERFERETGRKMQKEDRGPMEKNYNEYKHVKAKLRLLEALLSKHGS